MAVLLLTANANGQTRVSPPQAPAITGSVIGAYTGVTLRDINSPFDHGNRLTNGIATAIGDCGTTISCSIIVPPTYGSAEAVAGYYFDPTNAAAATTTSNNITVFDRRFGDARIAVNPTGFNNGLLTTPNGWVYNYSIKAAPGSALSTFYILQNSWDGGNNQQNSSLKFSDKTQWTPMLLQSNSYTPGQHITAGLTTASSSVGDSIAISNHVRCYGGANAEGDQGCRAADNRLLQGNVEYAGTLTGTPGQGAASLTVLPTQGAGTQGARRFLVKTNAGTLSGGTISNVTTVFNALTSVTGSGTAWPVSQVVAQLGTSVTGPGSVTVTPSSFTTGSLSLIKTTTMVCVADANSFEMLYPSSVSATGFTASFSKAHVSTSTLAAGGVCGYLLDLTADDVTNSTYTTHTQTITGTLHFAWPLVTSSSATSATLWVAGGSAYQQILTRWNANSANGYVMYPFAEVVSVQQGGGLSNTLSLGPNNVAWSAGDSVSETLYPAVNVRAGNNIVESYYPNLGADGHNFAFTYNSPLQGSDTMLTLANNAPSSFYSVNGGRFTSPWGLHIQGQTKQGLYFDTPSDQWTFGIGCTLTCQSTVNAVAAENPSYYDFLQYDESNARWLLTTSSNSTHYTLGATQLTTPFPSVYFSADGAGVGYLGVQSLRSGAAADTDISGEMTLNNASSVAYTFIGAYGSHPECLVKPQMDMGSGNRHWVTYSGSKVFTVNFATAVTGSVSYSCTGRN